MPIPDHEINSNDVLLLPLVDRTQVSSLDFSQQPLDSDIGTQGDLMPASSYPPLSQPSNFFSSAFDDVDNFRNLPQDENNVFSILEKMDDIDEHRVLRDTSDVLRHQNLSPFTSPDGGANQHYRGWCGAMNGLSTAYQPKQLPLPKMKLFSEHHPGNNRFYIQIYRNREKFMEHYNAGNDQACDEIAQKIIENICFRCEPVGRFLEFRPKETNANSEDWIQLGHGRPVIDQVKGALKDPPTVDLTSCLLNKWPGGAPSSSVSSSVSVSVSASASAKQKQKAHSNDITQITSMSMTSYRDDVASSCSNLDTSHRGTSYRDTHSQFETGTEASMTSHHTGAGTSTQDGTGHGRPQNHDAGSSNQKRKSKGMRRRGMISSELPSKNKMFDVNPVLSKLVTSVFNQPLENDVMSDGSECSESSQDNRSKRFKLIGAAPSVASSTTSSISGLYSDFANGMRMEPVPSSTTSFSSSKHMLRSTSYKRKKSIGAIPETPSTVSPVPFTSIQVKFVDEHTGCVRTRPLSSYDIICSSPKPELELLPINQVGNNRFRVMLQMDHTEYNSGNINLAEKNRIIYRLFQNILNSKKGPTRFIFQDPNNDNAWTQMQNNATPKFIKQCLEKCHKSPDFLKLPSPNEKQWVSKIVKHQRRRKVSFGDLQKAALKNINSRKKKLPRITRDPSDILRLQESVRRSGPQGEGTIRRRRG